MTNEKNKRVEFYLLGKMSATERRQFEQDVTTDTALATALNEQQMEHDVLEAMVEMDLFKEMKTWKAEAESAEIVTPRRTAQVIPFYRRSSTLAIAASFLLLIGAAFWLLRPVDNMAVTPPIAEIETPSEISTPTETPTSDNSIAQNEESETTTPTVETPDPAPNPPKAEPKIESPAPAANDYLAIADNYAHPLQLGTIRSSDNTSSLDLALADLKAGQLAEGSKKLVEIVAAEPNNSDALYYLGLAQYQQKNYAEAIAPLRTVSADAFYLENEKAQWYLILAYLQTGQVETATAMLKEIVADQEHSYYQPAVEIFARL